MRVVVDTNTLVSGMIRHGSPPGRVLDLWRTKALTILVSRELIEEYRDVLARDRFRALGTVSERLGLLEALLRPENVLPVVPQEKLIAIEGDPDDNRILECAVFGQAEAIITGDDDLLALSAYRGIRILPAKACLQFG